MSGLAGRLKAVQKEFWEVVGRRRPSVYSASIPRVLVLIMQKSSEATGFGLQTFITVCPGRGTEARRQHKHTQAVLVKNTQALNHERCNGWGEGGRVSLSPFVQGGGILGGMGGVRGVAAG